MSLLTIIEIIVSLIAASMAAVHYLHIYQLESYQEDGYLRRIKGNVLLGSSGYFAISGIAFVAYYLLPVLLSLFAGSITGGNTSARIIIIVLYALCSAWYIKEALSAKQKKPLKFTSRMKRLMAGTLLSAAVIAVIIGLIGLPAHITLATAILLPVFAGRITSPIEKKINKGFFLKAQEKLKSRKDLIKIGITGSYGKTSVKFMIKEILSEKYSVLATPASFNTPMGVSGIINSDKLKREHNVFIAEMGARHMGDIKEMVELVNQDISVITSVGPQHLETFGTIETVADTKNEIITNMHKGGIGFFAADNAYVDELYKKATCEKYITGIGNESYDMHAGNIVVGYSGSTFTLTCGSESVECETRVLGKHNIQNIVLSAMVAKKLGLSMEEIRRGIKRITPIEHRLELRQSGQITIIDDAFNSNPTGAKAALDVLNSFPARKIILTPGMVELGDDEERLNQIFGTQMASVCDKVILVGIEHTKPIKAGLLEKGYNESDISVVKNLDEALDVMNKITQPGDVVLIENDLPDNYNE